MKLRDTIYRAGNDSQDHKYISLHLHIYINIVEILSDRKRSQRNGWSMTTQKVSFSFLRRNMFCRAMREPRTSLA